MSFGPEYTESDASVYFGVISGTHSAGKTALLNDLLDVGIHIPEMPDTTLVPYPSYRMIGDVAFGFVPEATTAYMNVVGDITLATNGYTREHQIAMEDYALSLTMSGLADLASHIKDNNIRAGVLLADRTSLDGTAYRALRIPTDSPWVNGYDTDRVLYGEPFNKVQGVELHYERMWDDFLRRYCDFAIFPNHSELALEDNGTRLVDDEFRNAVGQLMLAKYTHAVGKEKIHIVSGDRNDRLAQLLSVITAIVK